jgi:aspartyl-tRNA(Asn)/glutamyl-tRNA(Gln) amidotransferase subunit B
MSEDTEVMIGLETHVQLDTNTKLFCSCPNEEAEEPNTHVCPICLGHPGSKPKLNHAVLKQAVKTALALQCDINSEMFFSRKTYFYPDMSKDYQITQYEIPVGNDGEIEVKTGDEKKDIGIKRLHIEEDPAKLEHVGGKVSNSDYTKIDYNRAGTPLLEIVTKPDFRSPEEARSYLQQLQRTLQYLEVYFPESDFAIKSDANISINGGERVEVKNITGTKDIEKALNYEITRQKQMAKRGNGVSQETRSFNQGTGMTESMRQKETEADYGYIFDPDLTRQELSDKFQSCVRDEIPELPHEKFKRFQNEYGLKEKLVESLVTSQEMAEDYEDLAEEFDPETVASWMTGELKKTLNYNEISYGESAVKYQHLKYLFELLEDDKISDRNAEMLLRELVENPRDPKEIVEEEDLLKADDDEVNQIVESVIEDNPDAVEDYKNSDDGAINFLVGQVMQQSQGKADPKTAREKLMNHLQ